ncbi:hypothetical protein LINPERHAP2_LOCUS865, partial [Linum perenne]
MSCRLNLVATNASKPRSNFSVHNLPIHPFVVAHSCAFCKLEW